jgi:hypothetical protein
MSNPINSNSFQAGPSETTPTPKPLANADQVRKLPNHILKPAVPWDKAALIDSVTVNAALRYRYKCMPPKSNGAQNFEIKKRQWTGNKHRVASVVDAPIHYREFVMDLNWSAAFVADMFEAAKWPTKCYQVDVMKMLIVYLERVRSAFIDEVRQQKPVSKEWRSDVLDSVIFVLFFDRNFGYLETLCDSTQWHSECEPGATLDVFKMGNSTIFIRCNAY